MVKRQKEKQYESASEFKANSSLRAGGYSSSSNQQVQKILPLECCALNLTKINDPVCTADGILFETTALLPFVLEHKISPVTGTPMTTADIITLNIDKNDEGLWQCPILTKVLTDHVKVVAIRQQDSTTANVYSWEAYHELNVKTKQYQDLISGQPFRPKIDVIVLNDPHDLQFQNRRDIHNFYHIQQERTLKRTNVVSNVQHSGTAQRVMDKIRQQLADRTTAPTSTASATVLDEPTVQQALFDRMRLQKRKGYCTIQTNMGPIGIELHCDLAPHTCTLFIELVEQKKYNNTTFHTLIRNTMIVQGATRKQKNQTKGVLPNEYDSSRTHSSLGIVSMTHPDQQFCITLAAAPQLDNHQHVIFGQVTTDGLNVLQHMNHVPTDRKNRPIHPIIIESIDMLVNPVKEVNDELERSVTVDTTSTKKRKVDVVATEPVVEQQTTTIVGKYLKGGTTTPIVDSVVPSRFKPAPKVTKFSNFSGW